MKTKTAKGSSPGAVALGLLAAACAAAAGCLGSWGAPAHPGAPGPEAWILFAQASGGGKHDLWRVRLDGSDLSPFSQTGEDEIPLAGLRGRRALVRVSGSAGQALAVYGGDSPARTLITPSFDRVELLSILNTTVLFGAALGGTDLHAIDWRGQPEDAIDLFPPPRQGETLLATTEDGWVIASNGDGEIESALLGSVGPRVAEVASGPGAAFHRLTNDGRVIFARDGRLFVADPEGATVSELPGVGEPQELVGLTRDDTILFREGGRLFAVRVGDEEPMVLLEDVPLDLRAEVDYQDEVVAVLGKTLARFSPRDPAVSPVILAETRAPIDLLRLYQRWAFFRVGGELRSVTLDGRVNGMLVDQGAERIRQMVFLPGENVGLLDDRDGFVTMHSDGSGRTVILEGEKLRGLQVLGGGRLLIELERGDQGDILMTAGPFSSPYPVASTPSDESHPVLIAG